MKALRERLRKIPPNRRNSQDCNIETLSEFLACCLMKFGLKTSLILTRISSLPICPMGFEFGPHICTRQFLKINLCTCICMCLCAYSLCSVSLENPNIEGIGKVQHDIILWGMSRIIHKEKDWVRNCSFWGIQIRGTWGERDNYQANHPTLSICKFLFCGPLGLSSTLY